MKVDSIALITVSICFLNGCKSMDASKQMRNELKKDLIELTLERTSDKYTIRYRLRNDHDFPIAVLRWQIPTETGSLPDRIFTFSPNVATFKGIVGFREWGGLKSVVVISPKDQYEVEVNLSDWYAGVGQAHSVSCTHFLQAARFRGEDKLELDSLELVKVKSNELEL